MSQEPMSIDELKRMAGTIRCDIIEMTCTAAAGHPGRLAFGRPTS